MSAKVWALALAVLCVTLSAAAQLLMKWGLSGSASAPVSQTYLQALSSPWVWLGLGLYGSSAVLWLWVLSRLDVSLAYPLVSLGFVLTLLAGIWWLGEPATTPRLLGAALIVAGVLLMASDA